MKNSKEPYKRDYILQKRLIILRSLLIRKLSRQSCLLHEEFKREYILQKRPILQKSPTNAYTHERAWLSKDRDEDIK